MDNSILIQKYDAAIGASCIELLKKTFPEARRKNLAWRFESFTFANPIMICAKHQGKVVSFNSWIPWNLSIMVNVTWDTNRVKVLLTYNLGERVFYRKS